MKEKNTVKVYQLATFCLAALATALQTCAVLLDYDPAMSVYRSLSGLGVIVGWLLFVFVLMAGSSLFLLPKKMGRTPLSPCGSGLALAAAISGAATVGASLVVAADAASMKGSIAGVSLVMAVTAFPAGVYLILTALCRRGGDKPLAIFGFFPVIWASLGLIRIYFDRTSAINDPVKTLLQVSYAAIMLYFLAELRTRVGKGGGRLRFACGAISLILGGASSVSMIALSLCGVPVQRGELLLAVTELLLCFYVGGRIASYNANNQKDGNEDVASEATERRPVNVIVLAGQSNAVGVGHCAYLPRHFEGEELERFFEGYDNVKTYYHSHNTQNEDFERTTRGCSELNRDTFGPDLAIADELTRRYPGEEIFLVKCAYGATGLSHDWAGPHDRYRTTEDGTVERPVDGFFNREAGWCLDDLTALLRDSLTKLEQRGCAPAIRAFLWMQGENDATNLDDAKAYGGRYRRMLEEINREFGDYMTDCVYVDGGISEIWEFHREVNDFKRSFAAEAENRFFLDTIAAGLTTGNEPEGEPDVAHYDSDSVIKLGRMFAEKIDLS